MVYDNFLMQIVNNALTVAMCRLILVFTMSMVVGQFYCELFSVFEP